MPSGLRAELQAHLSALELAVEALEREPEEAGASIRRIAAHVVQLSQQVGMPALGEAATPLLQPGGEGADTLVYELRRAISDQAVPSPILIVDDDRVSARLLQKGLATTNHPVVLAESVAEAEQVLGSEQVALVLLDLFLPDGDGRSFLVEMRRRRGREDLPVIVLSGNSSPLAKQESFALGANAYIEKPFEPKELVRIVIAHLQRTADQSDTTESEVPVPSRPARVLLAEDDVVTARLIRHRLERDGFEVVHCTDGTAAYEQAREGEYGLILLDVKLPGMDGFEILGRLREDQGDVATPILMLTAMGNEDDVVTAFKMGANDYVLKPFSPVELTARVRRLVSS